MCGRFVSSSSAEAIAEYFGATFAGETLGKNYNVAPTNDVYGVVADSDGNLRLELFHWGLIPVWAKDRKIGGYSKGMRQRVKLAQALVHDPVIVLLDEPMAGLDPAGRDEMLELVRRTHRDFGISVVLSSHIMGDVERACERILVLESGRVAQEGQVSAFAGDTATIYVEVTDRRDEFEAALRERLIEPEVEAGAVVIEGVDDERYDVIRDELLTCSMPPADSNDALPPEERDTILVWIRCGFPE